MSRIWECKTLYGFKAQIEIVWESENKKDNGYHYQRRHRYNLSFHEKSTLVRDLESWMGRKLKDEEKCLGFVHYCKGKQARLSLEPNQKGNKVYWNVTGVHPGVCHVELSGE